jgi:hypothetical protein
MKEKQIIFSGPMVMALFNTKPGVWPAEPIDPERPFKSMTRRVIKPYFRNQVAVIDGKAYENDGVPPLEIEPKYRPGDILWVRETFCPDWCDHIIYKADGGIAREAGYKSEPRWKSPIYMPRATSRLLLQVKSVRIERVQDISDQDIVAEGFNIARCYDRPCVDGFCSDNYCFKQLWNSLNAKHGYSWENNPWVWVYEFMRLDPEAVKGKTT